MLPGVANGRETDKSAERRTKEQAINRGLSCTRRDKMPFHYRGYVPRAYKRYQQTVKAVLAAPPLAHEDAECLFSFTSADVASDYRRRSGGVARPALCLHASSFLTETTTATRGRRSGTHYSWHATVYRSCSESLFSVRVRHTRSINGTPETRTRQPDRMHCPLSRGVVVGTANDDERTRTSGTYVRAAKSTLSQPRRYLNGGTRHQQHGGRPVLTNASVSHRGQTVGRGCHDRTRGTIC